MSKNQASEWFQILIVAIIVAVLFPTVLVVLFKSLLLAVIIGIIIALVIIGIWWYLEDREGGM